jgi:hypothetical protein
MYSHDLPEYISADIQVETYYQKGIVAVSTENRKD